MDTRDPVYILYVHDMDRAIAFYRDVLALSVVQHTPGWSMLRCGGATIALHVISKGSSESTTSHAGLNLQVDDLDDAISAVLAGGGEHVVSREPTSFVPVRMGELRDTEGNGFELRQFMSDGEDLTSLNPP